MAAQLTLLRPRAPLPVVAPAPEPGCNAASFDPALSPGVRVAGAFEAWAQPSGLSKRPAACCEPLEPLAAYQSGNDSSS